jgi:hypothetical protein
MLTDADIALENALVGGMKRDIEVVMDNRCFRAALILIYAGLDAMACLDMPEKQEDVQRKDFISWVGRYVRFSCVEQISALELYAARCGMLHSYGVESRLTREGKARMIGYVDASEPEVIFHRAIEPRLVLLSIEGLRDAFFNGIATYFKDLVQNAEKRRIAAPRILKLVQQYQLDG